MATQSLKKQAQEEAMEALRKLLQPGDTVYTIVSHISRSGMSRRIAAYVIRENQPRNISARVADAIGWTWKDNAVVVGGCGMDMGFHLVYTLAGYLFPGYESPDGKPFTQTGGYALRQQWM